ALDELAVEAASENDETIEYLMKDRAVIVSGIDIREEVLDRQRRFLGIQLQRELAGRSADFDLGLHVDSRLVGQPSGRGIAGGFGGNAGGRRLPIVRPTPSKAKQACDQDECE